MSAEATTVYTEEQRPRRNPAIERLLAAYARKEERPDATTARYCGAHIIFSETYSGLILAPEEYDASVWVYSTVLDAEHDVPTASAYLNLGYLGRDFQPIDDSGTPVAWLLSEGGNSSDPRRQYYDEVVQSKIDRDRIVSNTLARLAKLKSEAAEEGITANLFSEGAFRRFLRQHLPAREPGLALLDNGNLRAMWQRSNGEQVGLQFRGPDDVQFVLFKLRGNRLTSYAGRDTFSGITERLRADGLLDVVIG